MLGPGAALQCVSPGLWGQTDLLSSPSFTVHHLCDLAAQVISQFLLE